MKVKLTMLKFSEHTKEAVKKIRKSKTYKYAFIWKLTRNNKPVFIDSLSYWAKCNNLSCGSLQQVASDKYKRKSYKGWLVKKVYIETLTIRQKEIICKLYPELTYKFDETNNV